jgi:thiazole synthase
MERTYMAGTDQAQRRRMTTDTLSISVNGQHRRVPAGISVADLALELGLEPTRVAVERNLEIVPRSTLGEVKVEDGDDYEIVTFVGGG